MENLAELVCSNSLKSNSLDNAHGLLKEEMRRLHSLIISAADSTAVAAGSALAVDRLLFAREVEAQLNQQNNFTLHRTEITKIPEEMLNDNCNRPAYIRLAGAGNSTDTGELLFIFLRCHCSDSRSRFN